MAMVGFRRAVNHPLHQVALLAYLGRKHALTEVLQMSTPFLVDIQYFSRTNGVAKQFAHYLLVVRHTVLTTGTMLGRPSIGHHQCSLLYMCQLRILRHIYRLIVRLKAFTALAQRLELGLPVVTQLLHDGIGLTAQIGCIIGECEMLPQV